MLNFALLHVRLVFLSSHLGRSPYTRFHLIYIVLCMDKNYPETRVRKENSVIQLFENEVFGKIRVAGTSEDPLFCLADICRVLEIKNVSDCKSRLDQKGVTLTDTPTSGGTQQLVYINEKNLYKVIMRSDKPQAEPFQDWVCGEVLPSIRKHGAYMIDEVAKKVIESPDFLIQLAMEIKEEKRQLS